MRSTQSKVYSKIKIRDINKHNIPVAHNGFPVEKEFDFKVKPLAVEIRLGILNGEFRK